jgi:hypothetical protein
LPINPAIDASADTAVVSLPLPTIPGDRDDITTGNL